MAVTESRIVLPGHIIDRTDGMPHRVDSRIPHTPIPDALAAWREGDDSQLVTAEIFGNKERVGIGALKYLSSWLIATATPHVWIDHDPMTLQEKQGMFTTIQPQVADILNSSEAIRPVKTVTMSNTKVPYFNIAVTSLGLPIDNSIKAAIAADLTESAGIQVSTKTAKKATINPPIDVFDSSVLLGLQPGVIGPLVEPFNFNVLDRWYYLNEATLDHSTPVELALSFTDSLIVPKSSFEDYLEDYEKNYLRMDAYKTLQI